MMDEIAAAERPAGRELSRAELETLVVDTVPLHAEGLLRLARRHRICSGTVKRRTTDMIRERRSRGVRIAPGRRSGVPSPPPMLFGALTRRCPLFRPVCGEALPDHGSRPRPYRRP